MGGSNSNTSNTTATTITTTTTTATTTNNNNNNNNSNRSVVGNDNIDTQKEDGGRKGENMENTPKRNNVSTSYRSPLPSTPSKGKIKHMSDLKSMEMSK